MSCVWRKNSTKNKNGIKEALKDMKKNKVAQNMAMLYLMTFAKLVLPLMTLPYLTRVKSIAGLELEIR